MGIFHEGNANRALNHLLFCGAYEKRLRWKEISGKHVLKVKCKVFQMKHPSLYLDWYVHVPPVKYDFRSSGLNYFKFNLRLGEVDVSANFTHGNPETSKLLAQRYCVKLENVFVSSEGASGQNARVIRHVAERNERKTEVVVECPTYEPLLRQAQEHFPVVKRLERKERDGYGLDVDALRKLVSKKTGLLVMTNPHAPSGAVSSRGELEDIMTVAGEHGFYVLCDEVYAEFKRDAIPTIFSVGSKRGVATTSFSKAYGLGGLKMGAALAEKGLVDELYSDVLNTVGTSANVVEVVAARLLTEGYGELEGHKRKWDKLKDEAEGWLDEKGLEYFSSEAGVTFWVKLPVKDTYRWVNEDAIPRYGLAPVPGAFFLFKDDYGLVETGWVRLGLGNINPDRSNLAEAFAVVESALGL